MGVVRKQKNKNKIVRKHLPLLKNQFLIQTNCRLFAYGENPRQFEGKKILKSESFVRKEITKCNWYCAPLNIS